MREAVGRRGAWLRETRSRNEGDERADGIPIIGRSRIPMGKGATKPFLPGEIEAGEGCVCVCVCGQRRRCGTLPASTTNS